MSGGWKRALTLAVAVVVLAAIGGGTVAFAETPGDIVGWDLQYHGGYLPNGHLVPPPSIMVTRSPLRHGGFDYYAPVTRANFELGMYQTVVHRGADVAAARETAYAARAGSAPWSRSACTRRTVRPARPRRGSGCAP